MVVRRCIWLGMSGQKPGQKGSRTGLQKKLKKKRKPGLTSPVFHAKIILAFGGSHCGEVSEWFMELVLKTSDSRERTMGSNPILSAILYNK